MATIFHFISEILNVNKFKLLKLMKISCFVKSDFDYESKILFSSRQLKKKDNFKIKVA